MSLTLPAVLGGRYELLEEIGTGAYAAVYRAHDHVLDRPVAVKVLRDEVTSDETFARFEREVHVTATLEHAHILHVHDSGKHEGRPYIVTEYAPGGTLSEKLAREGQLQIADALQITCEVGIALAHAHASGVVHRDVKPDNILLGRGGVLLADFGIAISDTDEFRTRLTRSGMAVGTVQYMSPEQLCAERDIDGRSDQYALACVLYEMLAGVRPHLAATVEGLRLQRLAGQHLPVRAHRPHVPAPIDAAILKAMCSMAADRHRDMPTFLAALGMAGSGEFALMTASGSALSGGTLPSRSPRRVSDATHSTDAPATANASDSAKPHAGSAAIRASGSHPAVARPPRKVALLSLVGALAIAAVAYAVKDGTAVVDTPSDRVAVSLSPYAADADSQSVSARIHESLRTELSAWPDVILLDESRNGAGSALYLEPAIFSFGDSVRVQLTVDRVNGAQQRLVEVADATDEQQLRTLAGQMVREALSGSSRADAPGLEALPVRSIAALRLYVRAHALLKAGRLDSAQLAFRGSARFANEGAPFNHAHYWAAQVGSWRDVRNVEDWRADAELARRTSGLHGVDSLLAEALYEMSRLEYPAACELYRAASNLSRTSFTAWYGLGECARADQMVLIADGAPMFRSSLWSALRAYRQAVDVAPNAALLAQLFPSILHTTFAEGSRMRIGAGSGPSASKYRALPSLVNDTLAFFPIEQSAVERMQANTVPATYSTAWRRGRTEALRITERWITRAPESPEAWYYRSYALELAGMLDRAAGETMSAQAAIDRAAQTSADANLRVLIAVARTRILLRQGDVAGAATVARTALADTLVQQSDSSSLLAPLAALVGDMALVERFTPPSRHAGIPGTLGEPLDAFMLRAWMGECGELESLRSALESRAESVLSPAELASVRARWFHPVFRDAVPCLQPSIIGEFEPQIPLDRAYAAIASGDFAAARGILAKVQADRPGASSAAMSWDYLFTESWALAQAGDSVAARATLGSALDAIADMNGYTLHYVRHAAGLRRGLLLLRDLCVGAEVSDGIAQWAARADALVQTTEPGGGT